MGPLKVVAIIVVIVINVIINVIPVEFFNWRRCLPWGSRHFYIVLIDRETPRLGLEPDLSNLELRRKTRMSASDSQPTRAPRTWRLGREGKQNLAFNTCNEIIVPNHVDSI